MRIVGTICGPAQPSAIEVTGSVITAVAPAEPDLADRHDTLGGPDVMVCPALFDIQVNGYGGHDLNADEPHPEAVAAVVARLNEVGVGLYCPTVGTAPHEVMASRLRAIADACGDERVAAGTVAVHLEGPYISAEDGPRGAHSPAHVCDPDWDRFRQLQDAAGGRIGLVTLAPERRGAIRFTERLVEAGIVAAIGHTAADAAHVRDAVKAGARLATHLGNGAHALLPRHPNYIWEQLAQDALWASIIADGHHLPQSVVKCMIRAKGLERTILISDAVLYAGLEPGDYERDGRVVQVTADGKVQLKGTPFLAGATVDLGRGVANAVSFAGISLPEAVRMATLNPARLMGIDDRFGTVEVGKEASLLLFRWDERGAQMEVLHTLVRGEVV